MAVTTQKTTEYTNQTASPVTLNPTTSYHGRIRVASFVHDQSGVGDAGSTVSLIRLPAGTVKVLLHSSVMYVNWTASSQTLDLGWEAYTDAAGDAVAADPDGLVDGLDVDTAGYFAMSGALATVKAAGGTYTFTSRDGVVIAAKAIGALADGDDIAGYIQYVVD
tara:strand:- start:977 stop:1468 length:492 start_codon:yes stop_codon:yes gene_type:complete